MVSTSTMLMVSRIKEIFNTGGEDGQTPIEETVLRKTGTLTVVR